jgi:hypothetical protein
LARVLPRMEHPSSPLLPPTCLQRLSTPYRSSHGHSHYLPDQRHRARNRHGMHHEEDQGLWILGADEPAPNCDVAEDEVDQGQAGAQ